MKKTARYLNGNIYHYNDGRLVSVVAQKIEGFPENQTLPLQRFTTIVNNPKTYRKNER